MKRLIAIILALMIGTSVPLVIGDPNPDTEAFVRSPSPGICYKWEEPDYDTGTPEIEIMPNPYPDTTSVTINACVCDLNGPDDIQGVTARIMGPVLTLSDDELSSQFAYEYGPASATITDIPGDGVQFDFINLRNAEGTVFGDDFAVSEKAGGAYKIYPAYGTFGTYGDFSKYEKYSLKFENIGSTGASVNLKMNTGFTDPPQSGAYDTFWQTDWTGIGPGETKIVTLDFSSATVYNAMDDPVPANQTADGTPGVTVWRLDEVSDIGFQVCGESDESSASLKVSATGFTVKTIALLPDPSIDCTPYTCPCAQVDCWGYSGIFNMNPCDPAGHYTVVVVAKDNSDLESEPYENQFHYLSLKALTIDFDKVSFSGLPGSSDNPGTCSPPGVNNPLGTITSVGNDIIDVCMNGTDLEFNSNSIPIDPNLEADIDGTGYKVVKENGVDYTCWDVNLGCNQDATAEFRLDIPGLTPAGTYLGTISIWACTYPGP